MSEKMMSRRRFLKGASLALTGAALAACVPAQPGAQQSGQAAAGGSKEPITLTFHSRLGSHADWHKSRVALFEEQNPGLKLKIDELPADQMINKLYTLAAGGNLGDNCWTYLNTTLEHVKKKVAAPLDDLIAAANFDKKPFWPAIIQVLTIDGKQYALPNHGHFGTVAFYYNPDLWAAAGAKEPNPDWTVEDLAEGAKKITKSPDTWGFRATGGGDEHIPYYLRTFGGDMLSADGKKALFTDEKSLQGLKWMFSLLEDKADPCVCGDQQRENFVAGKVGAFNTTTGLVAEFSKVKDWKFKWGVTVAPKGPGGVRGTQVSGGAFCVTPNSKHPTEAFKVLQFFSTKEDGIQHVLGGAGSPGTRDDVWQSDELNKFSPIFREILAAYPQGAVPWYYPANGRTSEFAQVRDNNLQAIWTKKVGFDEGVEQLQKLCQEVLDKEPL